MNMFEKHEIYKEGGETARRELLADVWRVAERTEAR